MDKLFRVYEGLGTHKSLYKEANYGWVEDGFLFEDDEDPYT